MEVREEKGSKSLNMGNSLELDNIRYVMGLSTILVATIEEAKDRISQIEYISCSQLFPKLQSTYTRLPEIYSEAQQSAERIWKEKEESLLLQINILRSDKEQLAQENESFRVRNMELECVLGQKNKEVDDGMVIQKELIQMVQSSKSNLVSKEKQMKEQAEAMNALKLRQTNLEMSVGGLEEEIKQKSAKIEKAKELEANLLKKMEVQALEIFGKEQLLLDCEKEKDQLKVKFRYMEERIGKLEKELQQEAELREEAQKICKKLIQENEKGKLQLGQQKEEGQMLQCKVNDLERRVSELLSCLDQKSCEANKIEERLQHQLHSVNSELSSEKKKRADWINKYKSLKSQYCFLLKRHPQKKSVGEEDQHEENLVTMPDLEKKSTNTLPVNYAAKVENEFNVDNPLENEKDKSLPKSSSPGSGEYVATRSLASKRSTPYTGSRQPASSWRDTRSHQSRCGPDPHDDFLDTPLENIRENLNNAQKEKRRDPPNHDQKEVDCNSFDDDETEDMNVEPSSEKQQAVAPPDGSRNNFKYVGAVRKRTERENLIGVQCKQCKKFYDAVLLDDNTTTADDVNRSNTRCEHHEGVSRHRYKYVPPLTPEGFWNIGFESEM
ncbi:hypothetical protein SAY87_019241 [Trapa incisa]|uniref:DNA endonuclease activator Ctp1 C-terminal domain-containing protein n=1 Tax=Trapa incisa TaxID=236973 RepID=A0AAN7Q6Z5_9MYRT|nr:hypothetical protein SAY87_019241 [Trapa incisa]